MLDYEAYVECFGTHACVVLLVFLWLSLVRVFPLETRR